MGGPEVPLFENGFGRFPRRLGVEVLEGQADLIGAGGLEVEVRETAESVVLGRSKKKNTCYFNLLRGAIPFFVENAIICSKLHPTRPIVPTIPGYVLPRPVPVPFSLAGPLAVPVDRPTSLR